MDSVNELSACLCWFLQRGGGGIWAEENEGGKMKGEPSRDFAKVCCSDG